MKLDATLIGAAPMGEPGFARIPGWVPEARTLDPETWAQRFEIPGIVRPHYRSVSVRDHGTLHHVITGTYVLHDRERNRFFLWGDCVMGHVDRVLGPYPGDPRLALPVAARWSLGRSCRCRK